MIEVKNLFRYLNINKVNFFSGVPDSILKETKSYLESKKKNIHIPVSNEGSAVASGKGYNGINIKNNYSKIIGGLNTQRLKNNPMKISKKILKPYCKTIE